MVKFEDLQIGETVFMVDYSMRPAGYEIIECVVGEWEPSKWDIKMGRKEEGVVLVEKEDTLNSYTYKNHPDYESAFEQLFKTREEAQDYLDSKFNEWKNEIESLSKEQLAEKLLKAWDNEYVTKREYDVMKQKIEKEFNVRMSE